MANGNGLNTLEYVQKLEQAGIPRKQAEAQASVLYDLITSNLATKRDVEFIKRDIKELDVKIETVRSELKRDIENVRSELKRDIKELDVKIENIRRDIKRDMLIASGSIIFLILTGLVTLAKLGLLMPAQSPIP